MYVAYVALACVPPSSVSISGTYAYLGGQTLSLTATPVGGTGTPTYQWQKEISTGNWQDISGATSATYTKSNIGYGDSGSYRCVVSTGATCSTASPGYGVHVYSLNGGYEGDSWSAHDIVITSGTTGTATVHLAAGKVYEFKVSSNYGYWYGNSWYTLKDFSDWNFDTNGGNMRLLTGPEGDYTFTVDVANGQTGSPSVQVSVAYPSVSHPNAGYVYITKWWNNCYVHYWDNSNVAVTSWGSDAEVTTYTTICGNDYYYMPALVDYHKLIIKDAAGDPANTTGDQVTDSHGGKYITHDGSWGWHEFSTYSITFNGNGNTGGSMSAIEDICPNGSATLTANAYTKTDKVFAGWNTAADGSGTDYADEATISSITGNITLYAQWDDVPTPPGVVDIPGTVDKDNRNACSDDKWFADDTDYFNFGDDWGVDGSDGHNLTRWIQWEVNLLYSAQYTVEEETYCINGHTYLLELLDGNTLVASYTTADDHWGAGYQSYEQSAKWDLSSVPTGTYTLRIKNATEYGKPKLKSITLTCDAPAPVTIVDLPGTVSKTNVDSYSGGMTWYGANDEYFDLGPTSALNTDRWIEWKVRLIAPDEFTISEIYSCPNGHYITLDLMDGNTVVSTYVGEYHGSGEGSNITYSTKWNLTGVTPGVYTLRARNEYEWSQPKVMSITFTGTFIPGTIAVVASKVTDAASYPGGAYGVLNDLSISTNSGIPEGTTITDNGDNTFTINTETPITVTAPLTTEGYLNSIPDGAGTQDLYCVWRFSHWNNIPASGITSSVIIEAVYFPTFAVEYQTNGGVINEVDYAHWYRYTGDAADITPLPVDVTKPGYMFAGWYQVSTTELFSWLTGNYFGDYAGIWCLKAHWVLPCDEAQVLSRVELTGSGTSSYTITGYNDNEYAGTPVVNVSASTAVYDVDDDGMNETGYELGAANQLVFATLGKGDFRVGDLVRVTITAKNTSRVISSSTDNMAFYYGTGPADARLLVNLKMVSTPGIYEYTLDADDVAEMNATGANGVGVFREAVNGENPYVYSVEIVGCRDMIFDDMTGDHLWSTAGNWGPKRDLVPDYYQATRILKPCIVDIPNAHALNVKLCRDYTGHEGSLTINANAALAVQTKVTEVKGIDYVTTYPVTATNLIIKSNASNQGALVHGDADGQTHATVEFYARGAGSPNDNATWQYMGVPFSDVARAQSHYEGSWMCQWVENTAGNAGSNWRWVNNSDALSPFVGYALSNSAAKTFTNTGTLAASANQTLHLTIGGTDYRGWNMFANSWMAPIHIAQFQASDFGSAQATIYLFNTGVNDGEQTAFSETSSAGQYIAVPIASAGSMGAAYQYIAPMQGFYIVTESATDVTLDYNRLVRNPAGHEGDAISVLPNRSPRRTMQNDESEMPRIIIDVAGTRFGDRLYLFENADRTNGFDNAWDGYKFEGESYAPQLMTRTGELDLAVDVSPSFGGKRIAFRPGEDNEYTLRFSTTEEGLYLLDLSNGFEIAISDDAIYTFMAFNTAAEARFEIIDRRNMGVTTCIDQLYSGIAGEICELTVYTADGRLVEHRTTDFNRPLNLPQSGVYIVRMKTTAGLQVQKITF